MDLAVVEEVDGVVVEELPEGLVEAAEEAVKQLHHQKRILMHSWMLIIQRYIYIYCILDLW